MNSTQKFELWQVTLLQKLNDDSELVKNNVTGQLMVRRYTPADSLGIMQRLTAVRHGNLMAVYDCAVIDGRCVSLCEYISGQTIE